MKIYINTKPTTTFLLIIATILSIVIIETSIDFKNSEISKTVQYISIATITFIYTKIIKTLCFILSTFKNINQPSWLSYPDNNIQKQLLSLYTTNTCIIKSIEIICPALTIILLSLYANNPPALVIASFAIPSAILSIACFHNWELMTISKEIERKIEYRHKIKLSHLNIYTELKKTGTITTLKNLNEIYDIKLDQITKRTEVTTEPAKYLDM